MTTAHTTRYDTDQRVTHTGDGYTVQPDPDGPVYRVLPNEILGWGIYTGPNLDLAQVEGGGFALGYQSADHAIAAVLAEDTP